jgi:hypothetical protein
MTDSPRDVPAVVQVLCAFVRTHAQLPEPEPATAHLGSANLVGVDLTTATGLTARQLSLARTNSDTKFPQGLRN